MHTLPGRKSRIALLALTFVAGAFVGGLATSAAASRAYTVSLGGARLLFVSNQDQMLATAWNAGDMNQALAHATCAFDAAFGQGARYFDASSAGWSAWGGALTHTLIVEPNAEVAKRVRPTEEAVARAKIAVVLERLGRSSEANAQLKQAVKVSGVCDAAKWRDTGLKTVAITTSPQKPGNTETGR